MQSRTECIGSEIEKWFAHAKYAGLIINDEWWGRPYDNYFPLTYLKATPHDLIMKLDEHVLLTITDPTEVKAGDTQLVVSGFSQLVADWVGPRNSPPYVKTCDAGAVRFEVRPDICKYYGEQA